MGLWIARHRWAPAIGLLIVIVAVALVAMLLLVGPRIEPWLRQQAVTGACTLTLIHQHARIVRLTPTGLDWRVIPARWCAPPPLVARLELWERLLAGAFLTLLLTRRPARYALTGLWYWLEGVGRLVPGTTHGRAAWASGVEIRRRWVRPWDPPYVLGVARRHVVGLRAAEQNLNVLIVGQPGVGKSSALFIANLLRAATWRWPARAQPSRVATDPKREFYEATSRSMSRRHIVRLIDFYDPGGHRYNPLAHIHTPSDAQRFAEILIDNTGGRSTDNPFWDASVVLMLVAAIEHLNALARRAGRTAATLQELASFVGRADFGAMQQEMRRSVPTARRAAEQFMANVRKKPELEGSIQAGIPLRFQFLNDPTIADVTSSNDVDFHALGLKSGRPWMVYVVVTRGRERVLQPLIVSFFTQMFDTLVQDANRRPGGMLARPVVCELDELGTIGRIADLAGWLNTLRSAGVWCRLAVQTLAQLVETYGEVATEAITQACQTFVFFGGSKVSRHDAEWMAEQLGRTTVVQEGRTAGRRRAALLADHGGLTRSEAGAPLMAPDDFLRMERHWMVVVPRHARPLKLYAVPYSRIGYLRRKAGALGPELPVQATPPTPLPFGRPPYQWAPVGVPLRARPRHEMDWQYDL